MLGYIITGEKGNSESHSLTQEKDHELEELSCAAELATNTFKENLVAGVSLQQESAPEQKPAKNISINENYESTDMANLNGVPEDLLRLGGEPANNGVSKVHLQDKVPKTSLTIQTDQNNATPIQDLVAPEIDNATSSKHLEAPKADNPIQDLETPKADNAIQDLDSQETKLDAKESDNFYIDPIPLKEKLSKVIAIQSALKEKEGQVADKYIYDNVPSFLITAVQKIKSLHQGLGQRIETFAQIVDQISVWEHFASSGIIFTACILSTIITYFQLGWIAHFLSIWYLSFLYKINIDRLRFKIKAITVKERSIGFNDSDQETLEWFNGFVDRLWNNFEADLNQQIKEQIGIVLDDIKVPGFDEIRLSKFTLGSQAPRIETIKNFAACDNDNYVLDFDLLFFPYDNESVSNREKRMKELRNFELVVEAVVAMMPLPIALKEIFFNGQLRIQFQFTKTSPYIKMVEIGFVSSPTLDFVLKPLGAEVTKIAGLGSMIKDVVKSQVDALIVNPNKMSFNIDEMLNGSGGRTDTPAGVLRIILYQAKDLKNVDLTGVTFSNPAVLINMGGEEVARTEVKSNTLEPEWNSCHNIIIKYGCLEQGELLSNITFDVVNVSPLGNTTSLGSTITFPLSKWLRIMGLDFAEDGPLKQDDIDSLINEWGSPFEVTGNIWKDIVLDKRKHGNLRMDISFCPVFPSNSVPTAPTTCEEAASPKTPVSPVDSKVPEIPLESAIVVAEAKQETAVKTETNAVPERVPGVVTIILNQAKELSKGHNGVIQCIGKVEGLEVVKSAQRKRTINPNWGSKHSFFCADIETAIIHFGIMNKGNLIGECKVNLKKAKDSTDPWYKLTGGSGRLSVDVKFMRLDTEFTTIDSEKVFRYSPLGLLRMHLIEAKDLPVGTMDIATMGLATNINPYCKVYLHDRIVGATLTQDKDAAPRWNETFNAVSYTIKEMVNFEVFDESSFSKDNSLGHFELALEDLLRVADGVDVAEEDSLLARFIKDGLKVTKKRNGKYEVWAPLYKKKNDVEDETNEESLEDDDNGGFQKSEKNGPVAMMKKMSLKNVKNSISNVASATATVIGATANLAIDPLGAILSENQKGHIHFEFDIMNVKSDFIIDAKPIVMPQAADSNQEVEVEKAPIVDIEKVVQTEKSGILRLGIESATFTSKTRAYFTILCNEMELFTSHSMVEKVSTSFWYSLQDFVIADLSTSKIDIVMRDQVGEQPSFDKDPVVGYWSGNFIKEVLEKGKTKILMKQMIEESLQVSATLDISSVYFPIDCGSILNVSDSGLLHLDIVNIKDLGQYYNTFVQASLNGKDVIKTSVKRRSDNPEFEEGVDVPIHSRISSNLHFDLYEKKMTHDVLLGSANLSLDGLAGEKVSMIQIPLDSGKANMTLRYLFEAQPLKDMPPQEKRLDIFKSDHLVGRLGKGVIGKISAVGDVGNALVGKNSNLPAKRKSMRDAKNISAETLIQVDDDDDLMSERPSSVKSKKSSKSIKGASSFVLSMLRGSASRK